VVMSQGLSFWGHRPIPQRAGSAPLAL
jgi:hypothetical protein